jgi:quercetin dioxygenase-like cupin family protein
LNWGQYFQEGKLEMSRPPFTSIVLVVILASLTIAQDKHVIKPQTVISEIVEGMPKGDKQQVRVLTATFQPGDQTLFHTHRFPVTVYVLEGAFTLEKEGQQPVTVKTGQAMLMPPNVKMTGYNKSTTDPLRLVVFYVSDPDTPFLDAIH